MAAGISAAEDSDPLFWEKRSDGEVKWLNYPLMPHGGGIKGCTPIFSHKKNCYKEYNFNRCNMLSSLTNLMFHMSNDGDAQLDDKK